MSLAAEKLARLRALFASSTAKGIAAYIIPSSDAHQSEYVAACDERRAFISGFDGSAGTAVVTASRAALWTDGRYFLQASQQLSEDWTLMKAGLKDTPSIEKWLSSQLKSGDEVGFDPTVVTYSAVRTWMRELKPHGIDVVPTENLVDKMWDTRPPAPLAPAFPHPLERSGVSYAEKAAMIRNEMEKEGAAALVVVALDELAWLFNIRGIDVDFNPVCFGYAIVTPSSTTLYMRPEKLTAATIAHIGPEVVLKDYNAVFEDLKSISSEGGKVWLDTATSSWALHQCVPSGQTIEKAGPIALLKALKNPVELDGMRSAHVKDGVAVVQLLAWIEQQLNEGKVITECDVAVKSEEYRAAQPGFVSLSFPTIAGSGPNGAIIHYRPKPESAATVTKDAMLLIDNGGQYVDGTTDITRTVHFGTPSPHEKACFTRVLQGHIAVAVARFPVGTMGHSLDALARLALWQAGLDYRHGTGHGVGAFLNVHEGPDGIGMRPRAYTGGLMCGMTMTDEPGYYENGKFGIRIESVLVTKQAEFASTFDGTLFLEFENLTVCPIQTSLVDVSLLRDDELAWLNKYNYHCHAVLSPLLSGAALEYLNRQCVPLARA